MRQELRERIMETVVIGAFSVNEFCNWAGIGRTAAYAEMKAGRLQARKFGRRTLIFKSEAERWLLSLKPKSVRQ